MVQLFIFGLVMFMLGAITFAFVEWWLFNRPLGTRLTAAKGGK